jgi:hypothetical protein
MRIQIYLLQIFWFLAQIFTLLIISVSPVLSFTVFYFSALRTKIRASKKTTLSMFLGSLTGSLSFVLVYSTVLSPPTLGVSSILVNVVVNVETFGSLVGVSLCFFPALIAVLYAELKEKKTSSIII